MSDLLDGLDRDALLDLIEAWNVKLRHHHAEPLVDLPDAANMPLETLRSVARSTSTFLATVLRVASW